MQETATTGEWLTSDKAERLLNVTLIVADTFCSERCIQIPTGVIDVMLR